MQAKDEDAAVAEKKTLGLGRNLSPERRKELEDRVANAQMHKAREIPAPGSKPAAGPKPIVAKNDSPAFSKIMQEVADVRRKIIADFQPSKIENPIQVKARERALKDSQLKKDGLVFYEECNKTAKSSVIWAEPGEHYEGSAFGAIVLKREDFDRSTGKTSKPYPFASISIHALERMISRSGTSSLKEVMENAAATMCWSEVAKHKGYDGVFVVPHNNGLVFAASVPGGLRDTSDASEKFHHVSIMTTWVSEDDCGTLMQLIHNKVQNFSNRVAEGAPAFPEVEGIRPADIRVFGKMAEEATRHKETREQRKAAYDKLMGNAEDSSPKPKPSKPSDTTGFRR
jgi:hypothetical protein